MLIVPEFIEKFLEYHEKIDGHSEHTIRSYRSDLFNFCNWLKEYKKTDEVTIDMFDKMTLQDIMEWRFSITDNQLSTISRKVSALKSLFRHLNKLKLINNDISKDITKPKVPEKLTDPLDKETTIKLLRTVKQHGNEYEFAIISTLLNTAIRATECCNLNIDDIKGKKIMIRGGKGKKDRPVLANENVLNAIKAYLKVRPKSSSKALFLIDQFKSKEPYRTTYDSIKYMAKKYGKLTNIPDFHAHLCRHTCATQLLDEGVNIPTVQKLLGHKHAETTLRYAKSTTKQMEDAVNRLQFNI